MLLTTQPIELDVPETTLEEKQVHSLFSSTPLSLFITILLGLTLSASHWNIIGHAELMLWNSIMLFAIFFRTACWYLWRNHNHVVEITHWLFIFRGSIWLSGAAWGCSAFFMLAHYNATYQVLLSFTIAGVASGSLTTLAIDKLSALGFTVLTITPLTISLFMEHGSIAIPLGIMSTLYIVFVLSAAARARHNLIDQHDKNARLIAWGKERVKLQKLSKCISDAQAKFIKNSDTTTIFPQLLADILELTESKFGFIGEVFFIRDDQPELRMHTLSNISEDEQFNLFYQKYAREKTVLTDMNNLLGAAILKGRSVVSNNTLKDMRGGAMPGDYPLLFTFVAIPIFNGTTQVAVLSVANKAGGYDEDVVDFLKPVTNTVAQFIEVIRHNRQQKMYEEKIHNNTKHTKAILDDVFDAIITINKVGKIQSFNHAAETIFGYQEKDIINTNINRLIPEPSSAKQGNKAPTNQGLTHTYIIGTGQELAGLRRNGKAFPIEFSISELVIDNEPIYIGVVRDISERKRSEELKNQFIATVTHELCTPLTSISGALGILNSGSLGRPTELQQKLINIAMNNSLRLQKLINDLLDMDKLLSNRIDLQIVPLCIQAAVTKAIESNQTHADKYHIKLKLKSNQPSIQVFGDSYRIQQVCNNLLSNAVKFSPPHSTVEIETSISGRFAKVTITDHGCGIPEDFKTRIFQRFSQADKSDTCINGGSGLGLAISKELIQRMSGNIGFTSNKEDGSSFYFELPLAVNRN